MNTTLVPTHRGAKRCAVLLFVLLLLAGCATQRVTTAQRHSEIIRRYYNQWANHADMRTADELIATNAVLRHPHLTVTGLEAYKQGMTAFHAALPDLHFAVEDVVAQGDEVLVRWLMTGTQRGDFQGHAASGKPMRIAGMSLFRLAGGKIEEVWVNQDRLGMQQQLGWLKTSAPPGEAPPFAYYELRLYTVSSNKLDGVLERFRETVDAMVALPLILDSTAAIDFTASSTPRAFELRIYSVRPGKLDAFRNRWCDVAVPIYERHGWHSAGWWVAETKDADGNDQFVCLLTGDDMAATQNAIVEFHSDGEWQRAEKKTEKDGPLRSGVTAYKLIPTDFSALR